MAATSLTNTRGTLEKVTDYSVAPVGIIAASTTLLPADTGRTFVFSTTGAITVTLPAPAIPGLKFKFIAGATVANAKDITSPTANTAKGFCISSNGVAAVLISTAGIGRAAAYTICRLAIGARVGDYIECFSDGTNWNFFSQSSVTDGNLFA